MTIYEYFAILKRHWLLLLATMLVVAGAAFGATMLMPKVYTATTVQFVRGVPGTGGSAEYQAAQFATSRAKSYSVLINNADVLSGIINDLKLDMSPVELATRISADNPVDTVLINVTARGQSPDEAQAISVAAADNLARLIMRLESAGTSGNKSPIDIQTGVRAPKPTAPSSPRLMLNLGVGILLGFALGAIAALIADNRPARSSVVFAESRQGLHHRRRSLRHRRRRAAAADVETPVDDPVI